MHLEKEAPKLIFKARLEGIGGHIGDFDTYNDNLNKEKAIKKQQNDSVFIGMNGSMMNMQTDESEISYSYETRDDFAEGDDLRNSEIDSMAPTKTVKQ